VAKKFRRLAGKILPEKKVQALYQTVMAMEKVSSLTELTGCLVP
jgi:hypothetical protein